MKEIDFSLKRIKEILIPDIENCLIAMKNNINLKKGYDDFVVNWDNAVEIIEGLNIIKAEPNLIEKNKEQLMKNFMTICQTILKSKEEIYKEINKIKQIIIDKYENDMRNIFNNNMLDNNNLQILLKLSEIESFIIKLNNIKLDSISPAEYFSKDKTNTLIANIQNIYKEYEKLIK